MLDSNLAAKQEEQKQQTDDRQQRIAAPKPEGDRLLPARPSQSIPVSWTRTAALLSGIDTVAVAPFLSSPHSVETEFAPLVPTGNAEPAFNRIPDPTHAGFSRGVRYGILRWTDG